MGMMRWALAAALAGSPTLAAAAPSPLTEARDALDVAGSDGEPGVEPVALGKIAEEADRTKTRLEGIRNRTENGPSLSRVGRELPEIATRIQELEHEVSPKTFDSLSEREIDDLTFAWSQVERRIRDLQAQLGDESSRFEAELQRVQSMLGRWNATADADDITPTARSQAKSLLREVRRVEDQLREYLDEIHDAQSRVSANGQVVTSRLADFKAAREVQLRRILSLGEPLWSVDVREGPDPVRLALRTLRRQGDQVVVFAQEGIGSLVALVLTWLAAWWVLVALGRLPRDDDPDVTRGLESSLMRPRSGAVVLSVALFALLGPPVPWALRQALWLLILPGLIRLLTPTPYRSIATVFALPLLLSLLSEIVPETAALARFVHIVVSAAGLVAALWVGRWRRNEALKGLGLKGMRLAEILLTTSIIANVVGYGGLAPVINHATMFGIYAAVLIIACLGVMRALVRMSVKTRALRRSRAIRHHGERIADTTIRYLVVGAWVLWVAVAADGFDLADPVWTHTKLWMEVPWEIGAFSVAPADLLAFGLTLYAALLTSRLLGFVLDEDVLPRLQLARGLPPTISMLIRYLALAIGFFVATAAAGVELDKLSLLVGAFGVGIGFGLQNVVNNFVSGLILMFERPVKIGDTVEVGTLLGEVSYIGIRASRIRTLQGAEVIVPNANLISNEVTNWTLSDRRRRFEVDVGVAYGTDPELVLKVLQQVAADNERILSRPAPTAWFAGFGDSSLNFQLLVWTDDFDDWRGVRSEVTVAVNRAIVDAGIEIPFPQRDLHVRSVERGLFARARGETADDAKDED